MKKATSDIIDYSNECLKLFPRSIVARDTIIWVRLESVVPEICEQKIEWTWFFSSKLDEFLFVSSRSVVERRKINGRAEHRSVVDRPTSFGDFYLRQSVFPHSKPEIQRSSATFTRSRRNERWKIEFRFFSRRKFVSFCSDGFFLVLILKTVCFAELHSVDATLQILPIGEKNFGRKNFPFEIFFFFFSSIKIVRSDFQRLSEPSRSAARSLFGRGDFRSRKKRKIDRNFRKSFFSKFFRQIFQRKLFRFFEAKTNFTFARFPLSLTDFSIWIASKKREIVTNGFKRDLTKTKIFRSDFNWVSSRIIPSICWKRTSVNVCGTNFSNGSQILTFLWGRNSRELRSSFDRSVSRNYFFDENNRFFQYFLDESDQRVLWTMRRR